MKLKKKIIEFLEKNTKFNGEEASVENANKADKLGLPKNIWIEMTREFRLSNLKESIDETEINDVSKQETAFMAGFYCGFVQFNNKKKK